MGLSKLIENNVDSFKNKIHYVNTIRHKRKYLLCNSRGGILDREDKIQVTSNYRDITCLTCLKKMETILNAKKNDNI